MTEAIMLDEIDEIAASAFEGYVVRKDLAQQFKGAYPVPTYVGEFLIGRYCATTDPEEIEEGLQVVRRLSPTAPSGQARRNSSSRALASA
jgi:ATP-dependent Lon protease